MAVDALLLPRPPTYLRVPPDARSSLRRPLPQLPLLLLLLLLTVPGIGGR